jgi:hypothetical protein
MNLVSSQHSKKKQWYNDDDDNNNNNNNRMHNSFVHHCMHKTIFKQYNLFILFIFIILPNIYSLFINLRYTYRILY